MTKFNQNDYPDAHTITGAEVENYLYAMLPTRDEVLAVMEEQAIERRIPIVGPIVGRLFQLLAQMIRREDGFRAWIGDRLFHHLVGARGRRRRPRSLHRRQRAEGPGGARIFRASRRYGSG